MNKTFSLANRIALVCVAGVILLGVGPLFWFLIERNEANYFLFDRSLFAILLFTLKQALLSSIISVGLGLAAARAMARREFLGKTLLLNLFAVPQSLPAIVAVLGFLSVFGNAGLLPGLINTYGLTGIVMVHVFFNLPLSMRLCLETLNGIAPETFRLSQQLAFSDRQLFRHVEWPALASSLPRIFALIFLLCAASFIVVLTLGGPSATTLEVAIFQSLRMDFDVGRAFSLSVLQIALSLALIAIAGRTLVQGSSQYSGKIEPRTDGISWVAKVFDYGALVVAALLVLPPMFAILVYGLPEIMVSFELLKALAFSVLIGGMSAILAVALAWSLSKYLTPLNTVLALSGFIVPPALLATGWFLLFRNISASVWLVIVLVVALNSLMALPFTVAILSEGFKKMGLGHEKLCAQLGLHGWYRFWWIDFQIMKTSAIQALLLAFVFSLGDLTAVTLLGNQGLVSLPALLHQQMGHYRSQEAAGTALILAGLCFAVAALAQKIRSSNDHV